MAGKKNVSEWEAMFHSADKDGSKTLDILELRDLLRKGNSNLKDSQIADTFIFFDGPRGDKKISLDEFVNGMVKFEAYLIKLKELFQKYDKDNSKCLNREELKSLLNSMNSKFTDAEVSEILNDADKNGDGQISMPEFINACS